jgi:MerR family Zn(II)-responsive transcriptional regulator of zntA
LLSIDLDKSNWACADVEGMVDLKLAQVQAKIAELLHFQTSFRACRMPAVADREEHCSI